MALQTIINNATFLTIDKRRVVASSISRSGHYKTAERSPAPYSFTVGMHGGLTYSTNRDLLEDLDNIGSIEQSNISLANNTNMAYITNYQGALSNAQLAQIDVVPTTGADGANIHVDTTGVTGSPTGILFAKGDFIQPLGNTSTYRYPYQVTSDVTYSSSADITVPVHRPVLSQSGVSLSSITAVTAVQAYNNGSLATDAITVTGGQIFADGTLVTFQDATNGNVTPLNTLQFYIKWTATDGGLYELYDNAGMTTVSERASAYSTSNVGNVVAGVNSLRVGNDVRFHVNVAGMPTYSVVPYDMVEFSDNFQLIEVIT